MQRARHSNGVYWAEGIQALSLPLSAVEIGTTIYYRVIDVFRKVSDEIKLFMEENGHGTIKQMVGIAHG